MKSIFKSIFSVAIVSMLFLAPVAVAGNPTLLVAGVVTAFPGAEGGPLLIVSQEFEIPQPNEIACEETAKTIHFTYEHQLFQSTSFNCVQTANGAHRNYGAPGQVPNVTVNAGGVQVVNNTRRPRHERD